MRPRQFRVEYEIPPMRAIYIGFFDADSEEALRDYLSKEEPMWVIRKIEKNEQ